MLKKTYHPKAFLSLKRNVIPGLIARTMIILHLEKSVSDVKSLSQETELSYRVVLYHLHLLKSEGIILHNYNKPYFWKLTGSGQQRLVAF